MTSHHCRLPCWCASLAVCRFRTGRPPVLTPGPIRRRCNRGSVASTFLEVLCLLLKRKSVCTKLWFIQTFMERLIANSLKNKATIASFHSKFNIRLLFHLYIIWRFTYDCEPYMTFTKNLNIIWLDRSHSLVSCLGVRSFGNPQFSFTEIIGIRFTSFPSHDFFPGSTCVRVAQLPRSRFLLAKWPQRLLQCSQPLLPAILAVGS